MLQRVLLSSCRVCTRLPSTSRGTLVPSLLAVRPSQGLLHTSFIHGSSSDSLLNRVRDFVFASEKENFHQDFVERSHKWDGVEEKEWMLIYRDWGASRTFLMMATLFPAFIVGCLIVGFDIVNNGQSDRMDFVQRIVRDAKELGYLIVPPAIALLCVIAILLRVQQCRVLRIYQNRQSPDSFMAVASRTIVGQKKVSFSRLECSSFYFAEEQSDGVRVVLNFLLGNMQVGRRRFLIMDDSFRGNNYRSYMLNETSIPPRL